MACRVQTCDMTRVVHGNVECRVHVMCYSIETELEHQPPGSAQDPVSIPPSLSLSHTHYCQHTTVLAISSRNYDLTLRSPQTEITVRASVFDYLRMPH